MNGTLHDHYVEAFAAIVRERGAPHANLRPSATFTAVLIALAALGSGPVGEVQRRAGTAQGEASRVLGRMERLGLVASSHGRGRRHFYALTEDGRALAATARRGYGA